MKRYNNIEKSRSNLGPYKTYVGYGMNKVWKISGDAKQGFVAITTDGNGEYHYEKTLSDMSRFLESK